MVRRALRATSVLALVLAASTPLFAKISTATLGYASAAPLSIPVNGSGITMVRWTSYQNINDTNYSNVTIQLTSDQNTATFNETLVTAELRYALNNSTIYSAAGPPRSPRTPSRRTNAPTPSASRSMESSRTHTSPSGFSSASPRSIRDGQRGARSRR